MDDTLLAKCASVYHCINMRTTVTLDDDIFNLARAQSQASGMRLGKVISLMARRGLEHRPMIEIRNGLPVFPNRTNEIIPADRVRKILDEEMW
jgi:hypothetical protein